MERNGMVPEARKKFNEQFTEEKYRAFKADMEQQYPGELDFRVAETPVFIPRSFKQQVLDTCERIIDEITTKDYLEKSLAAIPDRLYVPGEDAHPHFIAFDFGICTNEQGGLEPQLIEMQGFPTMFAYQVLFPEVSRRHFDLPHDYNHFLNGFNKQSYLELLRKIIVADENPENVILLEIFPHQQKTRIDFYATEDYLGIKTVCLTELEQEGKKLFYRLNGKKTPVHRIYNRLIFDDLFQQPQEVQEKGKLFQQELEVTWVPHPNWFYRYSKFSLPFISHRFVPPTQFLHEVQRLPSDLQNYVVKPLFSFAGQGVIIDVTKKDIDAIRDKQNWILQKKVAYAAAIETPDEPAKAELRIFYFWEPGAERPVATNNLARLSKGKMIGVRYNKDKSWVGGTFCLFEA
jgi:hypothetical protein